MRKIISGSLFAAAALTLSGCDGGALDTAPQNKIVDMDKAIDLVRTGPTTGKQPEIVCPPVDTQSMNTIILASSYQLPGQTPEALQAIAANLSKAAKACTGKATLNLFDPSVKNADVLQPGAPYLVKGITRKAPKVS